MSRVYYSNQDKEDSNIFKCIFQYLYAESGMTLSALSKETGLSVNALTLMKNGQKIISFSAFDRLYTALTGESFHFEDSVYEEAEALFTKMLKHHISIEVDEMTECIQTVFNNRALYENSFAFFLFHLIEMFWIFWNYEPDVPKESQVREDFWKNQRIVDCGKLTLPAFAYSFFLDVSGLQCEQEREMPKAMEFYTKAFQLSANTTLEGLRQCITYHIARISYVFDNSFEGYLSCQDLAVYFTHSFNPLRCHFIKNVMIYLLTDMQEYSYAHAQGCALLNASYTITDPDLRLFVCSSLAWNAICAGWYDIALDFIQKPDLKNKMIKQVSGFEPFCLLQLGRREEARQSLNQWKNKHKPKKIELLHAMVDDLLEERKRMFLRSCSAFIAHCHKHGYHMSERSAYILRLETMRKYEMKEEYLQALQEYLVWDHPKPKKLDVDRSLFSFRFKEDFSSLLQDPK